MLAGQNGARGRIRTCTGDALDVVSLLLDHASRKVWGLRPVMPRPGLLTNRACGLPRGGDMACQPVGVGGLPAVVPPRGAKAGRSCQCCPEQSEFMKPA